MKLETQTVRIGEWLGPVDWSYDFASHGWDRNRGGGFNPALIPQAVERLRKLAANPEHYQATTDGGIPRVGWGDVLHCGMFDGWPYWRPVPSVLIAGIYGGTPACFMSITDIRERKP